MKIHRWMLLSIILLIIIIVQAIVLVTLTTPKPVVKPPLPSRYDQISHRDLIKYALEEGVALSYGMPPGWSHYGIMWNIFTQVYGIDHSDTDLASAVVVATLEAAKGKPDTDVADLGASFAMIAAEKGLTDCYIPPHFDAIPPVWKHPEGCWIAPYYGTLGIIVNVDALKARGVPVPRTWKDLLNPIYKGMVVYMDPSKSATGQLTVLALAYAMGGDVHNWKPGIEFLKKLHEVGNVKYVSPLIPTADYQKGEIPIFINFDFNGLTYKYTPGFPNTEFIIPEDGTVTRAYAVIIAKGAPHPFVARLFLNFYFSDLGSLIISLAFARPTRQDYTPPEFLRALLPPEEAYARAIKVDEGEVAKVTSDISDAWAKEVLPIAGVRLYSDIDGFIEKDSVPVLKPNPYLLEKALPLIQEYIRTMRNELMGSVVKSAIDTSTRDETSTSGLLKIIENTENLVKKDLVLVSLSTSIKLSELTISQSLLGNMLAIHIDNKLVKVPTWR